jgi:hypothetical protein
MKISFLFLVSGVVVNIARIPKELTDDWRIRTLADPKQATLLKANLMGSADCEPASAL